MSDVLIGLAGSMLIAGLALYFHLLSFSGAFAAVIVGTVLYSLGSLPWYGTLIAFFISSSLLSKLKREMKKSAEERYEKTGKRDAGQVLANGGVATVCCLGFGIWPHELWLFAFIGALAAVTADTWATEIGGFSGQRPISIVSGQRVEPGTSGGLTVLGSAASLAGASFIGLVGWLLMTYNVDGERIGGQIILIAAVSGFVGALVDSLVGAIWQRMYQCRVCGKEMEAKRHCETEGQHIRGVVWMNNDAVNTICSFSGALVAAGLGLWML